MAATIEADVEKLRQAERMRRDLIGNISHDLRSPLASVQGYLETMVLKDEAAHPRGAADVPGGEPQEHGQASSAWWRSSSSWQSWTRGRSRSAGSRSRSRSSRRTLC